MKTQSPNHWTSREFPETPYPLSSHTSFLHPPALAVYFLSLWIYLFWTFQRCSPRCVIFCVWLLSLSMFSRFIHAVAGLLLFFPLKIFAGVQEIQKHKMLLFVKVPSSNQADFPLPLNWNDKHRSLPGIWHLLWFFFFMSKWQTHNYQGYLIFSCSNSWWHFFLMSFFPSHYLVFSQKWGWRRWWHPTPVLLPGKSHGRRSLVGHGVTQSQTRLKWHCSSSSRSEESASAVLCSVVTKSLHSVQFSHSVVSDSLRPHEPQHIGLPTSCEGKCFLSNFYILKVNFFLIQVIS